MTCYLCGKNSARITVERHGQPDETYTVCGVCDEKGLYCFSCDVPLGDRDEKFELDMGWYSPPEVECERCAEARFDNYMETRVG
jgi:peptide methionine sulfoxide reductase MsrB